MFQTESFKIRFGLQVSLKIRIPGFQNQSPDFLIETPDRYQ